LLSPPGVEKATSKNIHMFVNNRWVKDKLVRMGVMRGYHSHLLKGKFPICIMHLYIDPTLVDVNVHPAKTELRFQYASEVQSLIAIAIKEAIRKGDWAQPSLDTLRSEAFSFDRMPSSLAPASRRSSFGGQVSTPRPVSSVSASEMRLTQSQIDVRESLSPQESDEPNVQIEKTSSHIHWDELTYCGSYAKCYLMFEGQGGLLVVDQHAFHERILYERFLNDKDLVTKSQPLLMPEEVVLTDRQILWLDEHIDLMSSYGFKYQKINSSSIEVEAVPAILAHRSIDEMFDTISSDETTHNQDEDPASLSHLLIATMACHAAIRSGEELGENERRQLMKEAEEVDFYHNCPHGRPVFKWFRHVEVERWFERT